jgi:hypothetical protein
VIILVEFNQILVFIRPLLHLLHKLLVLALIIRVELIARIPNVYRGQYILNVIALLLTLVSQIILSCM